MGGRRGGEREYGVRECGRGEECGRGGDVKEGNVRVLNVNCLVGKCLKLEKIKRNSLNRKPTDVFISPFIYSFILLFIYFAILNILFLTFLKIFFLKGSGDKNKIKC